MDQSRGGADGGERRVNMQGGAYTNGHVPLANGSLLRTGSMGDRLRAPTVNEALPFTPFSSIVPFNPELVPAPLAFPTSYQSTSSLNDNSGSVRNVLQQLSAGADSVEKASERCRQTLIDLQKLLDPDNAPVYTFKKPKQTRRAQLSNDNNNQAQPALSDFAKMVLQTAPVGFRYLTPEFPGPVRATEVNGHSLTKSKVTATPRSDARPTQPIQVMQPMQPIQPQQNGTQMPDAQQFTPSQIAKMQAVMLPVTLTPAQRAEYQYISEADIAKQKGFTPSNRAVNVDQRQKGDAAVEVLEALLSEMTDAEDQLQSGVSEEETSKAAEVFESLDSEEGPVLALHQAFQERLDQAVQKVVGLTRLDSIDVEDLVHLQRVCERNVSIAAVTTLQIGDEWSEGDVEEWQQKLTTADRGLLASMTLLRVMIAGRQEKKLQSEDLVRTVLDALKNVLETGFISIAEERATLGEKVRGGEKAQGNPKFTIATNNRKTLQALLKSLNKSLRLLGGLLAKVDVDETAISSVVYMCKTLIFAENASSEKDSVLGVQNFEKTRKYAMDVMAGLFTRYPEQRQSIFDEILTSLEKLPATKQSARQYRLPDTKPIQLVSALLMRLIQTSATRGQALKHVHTKEADDEDEDEDADGSEEESESDEVEDDGDTIRVSRGSTKRRKAPEDLASLVKPLRDASHHDASYVVRILFQRALMTTKNSDEPYRKLLDIFTEDFLTVLGSSDWPAAELLLRTLLSHTLNIAQNPKSPVPSRNLALELLATMGCGILDLQLRTQKDAKSIETGESDVAAKLVTSYKQLEDGSPDMDWILSFEGLYRIVLEYVESCEAVKGQLQTAKGFYMTQWAHAILSGRESSGEPQSEDSPYTSKTLKASLRNMIMDPQWLEEASEFGKVSTSEGKLATSILTLNSAFCKAFHNLFGVLLVAMTSEHPTMRSKALKSVVTLLEKDPSLLDRNRNVLNQIVRCAEDASSLVRDSALALIAKCISLKPELDFAFYKHIIARAEDPAQGVRKRAIKLLKDVYLRNEASNLRSSIAKAIISRIKDMDDSVNELARQTMEEIWFAPFYSAGTDGESSVEARLRFQPQAALVIETASLGDSVLDVLVSLLRELSTKSKSFKANARVCKSLVNVLFEGIIDNNEIPGSPTQDHILEALTAFAKATPRLFEAAQLEQLEPYTKSLQTQDDLVVFRFVLAILRHTMHHTTLKPEFLTRLQNSLMGSVSRIPKAELAEVVNCLWTIDGELLNTARLVSLMSSVLTQIQGKKGVDFSGDTQNARKITRLMNIAGQVGRVCDLEQFFPSFKEKFAKSSSNTVAGLAVELLCDFTTPRQPLSIREASLENICAICQRWPKLFLRADVLNALDIVTKDHVPSLEHIFLAGLEGFFSAIEASTGGPGDGEDGDVTGRERLARTYVATDEDGASASLCQRFLPDITRLALGSLDDLSFTATKLIASIIRQGLPHPKECGPSLVALETSPNPDVARLAFAEHRTLQHKHESIIEKEYMRAVQQAFAYQQKVVGDLKGFRGQPPVSKLHHFWDVLKGGKPKVRQKFISNISQTLGFDATAGDGLAAHLTFTRFCAENLAFFEYDRVDDLLLLISSLEKTFASTGTDIAQTIESEGLDLKVNPVVSSDPTGVATSETMVATSETMVATSETMAAEPAPVTVDPAHLQNFAVSSQVLLVIWETRTYLTKLWLLQKAMKKTKAAEKEKENSKTPSRATNAPSLTADYLKRIEQVMEPTRTVEDQRQMCRGFITVMSVDDEAKVQSGDENNLDLLDGGDTGSERGRGKSPSTGLGGSGRGRKRKSSVSNGTPRKKRGRPRKSNSMRMDEDDEDADGDLE